MRYGEVDKKRGGAKGVFEQMEQRKLAAQKLRQMWQGNLVIMISVIFMVVVVVIMLMSAMTNPFTMYVGGGL